MKKFVKPVSLGTKHKESWVLGYIVPEREEDHYQIRQQT